MNLNDFLRHKYAFDTLDTLLAQLHSSPLARFPQPQPVNPTNAHTLQRLVTADALDDAGRGGEAALLRDPQEHVVVRDGRVRAGRFTDRHLAKASQNVHNILENWFEGLYEPTHHTEVVENQTPVGDGTAIVRHFPYDTEDGEDGEVYEMPYHQVGPHLADSLEGEGPVDRDESDDPHWWDQQQGEFEHALENLRNAPYDEVDPRHDSERSAK